MHDVEELRSQDERIADLAASLLNVVRQAQEANVLRAWDVGDLLEEALQDVEDERTCLADLAKSLNQAGCEVTTSTLTGYRRLRLAFDRNELPDLVQAGMSPTHAQMLADCDQKTRQRVLEDCREESGRLCRSRQLKQAIKEEQKQRTRAMAVSSSEIASEAREQDQPLAAAETPTLHSRQAPSNELRVVPTSPAPKAELLEAAGVDSQGGGEPSASSEVASDDRPSRDLSKTPPPTVKPKGFTQSPIKVIKAADNFGIKLLGQSADLMLALDEVGRFGYDSERSLKNFVNGAESLRATLQSYQQVLPEVLERLNRAIRSLDIADS